MPYFERCPKEVEEMASALIQEFEEHRSLANAKVRIDFLFAFADLDERTGEPLNDALRHHGRKALGLARKLPPKQRAAGRGDAEICLDGDWWREAASERRRALLDHELHHLAVKVKNGTIMMDAQGRPKLSLRQHDFEFGWFNVIAARHGMHSIEVEQAGIMMTQAGQLYWPEIVGALQGSGHRARHLQFGDVRMKVMKPAKAGDTKAD